MKYNRSLLLLPISSLIAMNSCSIKENESKNEGEAQIKYNVLFIPVDDLRPEFGCYGDPNVKTPNIDRLAQQGVVFNRTYCQEAICNPSRASLLTGLRPDSIEVWDLQTNFRDNVPDVVTLPQYFKENGYTTIGFGKAFHNNDPDTISWSVTPENLPGFPFDPDAVYANDENIKLNDELVKQKIKDGKTKDQLGYWYVKSNATEIADVDDDFYYDGAQTTRAIEVLRELKDKQEPFFLSVGYYRPHLPFNAPKKYWDMYDRDQIPLADNQYPPKDSPYYSVYGDAELRGYSDCKDLPLPTEQPWDEARQKELKHGYFASVSYTDAQIGRLVDELNRLGLAENTIIILWGDHGWKLGEHNGWAKQTNYEIDTHVPMIISGASVAAKGEHSDALTEFVDIYPTLCDMTNLPIPSHLQGTSVKPLLENPDKEWKTAAFSQFLTGQYARTKNITVENMGYAMRTDKYRYVEWYKWNKKTKTKEDFLDCELYDHDTDPEENQNLANKAEYKELVKSLSEKLNNGWRAAVPKN